MPERCRDIGVVADGDRPTVEANRGVRRELDPVDDEIGVRVQDRSPGIVQSRSCR